MLDGMYLYEIVLLIGGAILFLAAVIVLLRQVFTNHSYKGLMPLFLIAVLMMGFPAVSAVKFGKDLLEIDKQTHQLQEHPDDQATRAALSSNIKALSGRPIKDPQTITTLAQAQFALGEDQQAKEKVDQALAASPSLTPAKDLKAKIEVVDKLNTLTAAAQKEPDNTQVKQDLQNALVQANHLKIANPKALDTIKKAGTVLQSQPAAGVSVPKGALVVPAGQLSTTNH